MRWRQSWFPMRVVKAVHRTDGDDGPRNHGSGHGDGHGYGWPRGNGDGDGHGFSSGNDDDMDDGTGDGDGHGDGDGEGLILIYGGGHPFSDVVDADIFGPLPMGNEEARRTERIFRCAGCVGGYECSIHGRRL